MYLAACDAADAISDGGGCGLQQQPAEDAQQVVVLHALVVMMVVFCMGICICLCICIWLHVTQLMSVVVGRSSSQQTMPSEELYSLPWMWWWLCFVFLFVFVFVFFFVFVFVFGCI